MYPTPSLNTTLCAFCNTAFEPRGKGGKPQRFCSRRCGEADRRARERAKLPNTICEECNEAFYVRPYRLLAGPLQAHFCSVVCKNAALGRDHQEAGSPLWKGDQAMRSTGWRRARRRYQLDGPCECCGEQAAVHRHHRDGNTLNNDAENVQALCARCHVHQHRTPSDLSRLKPRLPHESLRLARLAKLGPRAPATEYFGPEHPLRKWWRERHGHSELV